MKWLAVLTVLLASCGTGQTTYSDRVSSLPLEQAHPLYQQLLPLLEHPVLGIDDLLRTWKQFVGAAVPLRSGSTFTFVYYDFSHTLNQVYLEASFSPKRAELLNRVGQTSLFMKVYSIPRPAQVFYRFSDGKQPLPDPFHSEVLEGDEFWQPLTAPAPTEPATEWVVGASEPALEGQDVRVVLPPGYRTDLGLSYPLVVVVGVDGMGWAQPVAQLLRGGSLHPFVAVAVSAGPNLKTVLEERIVPWMRSRYRASVLPSELVLIGWGSSARPVQELAAARPDFWIKTWSPLDEQARTDQAWATLAPAFFRTQFSEAAP